MAGAVHVRAAATEILVEKHLPMAPPDRDYVQITVPVEVHRQRTIMVLITGVNQLLTPATAMSIKIFKHQEAGRVWILEVMFTHHDVEIAVTVDIDHVQAHRPNHSPD